MPVPIKWMIFSEKKQPFTWQSTTYNVWIPIFHVKVYGKFLQRENIVYLIFCGNLSSTCMHLQAMFTAGIWQKKSSLHPFLGSPSVNCQTLTGRGRFLISFKNSAKKKALSRILTYFFSGIDIWWKSSVLDWKRTMELLNFLGKIFWKFLTRKH